jgi:hypothetical protein
MRTGTLRERLRPVHPPLAGPSISIPDPREMLVARKSGFQEGGRRNPQLSGTVLPTVAHELPHLGKLPVR